VLPNIYDTSGLADFCGYDSSPALTQDEYHELLAIYERNFDLSPEPAASGDRTEA
jgi:hypothetical protein